MTIQLYINGTLADLPQQPFTYNLQANNMFDFDTREFSHSEVIYLPTTPTNRRIFNHADLPASDNKGAYQRYTVDYYVNGMPIVLRANGFLLGKRNDTYLFDFKDNSKDIYASLVGKKLHDLPFEELSHNKDLDTIIAQNKKNEADFIYAIADYGGETFTTIDQKQYYNFDYCLPAVKMDWILQKIKTLKDPAQPYEFQSEFFDSDYWKSLYMTVSNAKNISKEDYLKEFFSKKGYLQNRAYSVNGINDFNNHLLAVFGYVPNADFYRDLRGTEPAEKIIIQETGKYKIYLKATNTQTATFASASANQTIWLGFRANEQEYGIEYTDNRILGGELKQHPDKDLTKIVTLQQGDEITLFVRKKEGFPNAFIETDVTIEIYKTKENTIDLKNLLSDMSLLDWFKEVTRLFSLTPMKDNKLKNIQQFYTLSERVNKAPVIDWSDKFIRIIEEKYHDPNAYAQVNKFKYQKYDPQSNVQDSNDFSIRFNDEALPFEKEFQSKFFGGITNNYNLPYVILDNTIDVQTETLDTFQFFEKEVKEKEKKDGQKEIEISYKEKSNRYHIFSANWYADAEISFSINEKADNKPYYGRLPVAEFYPLRWEFLIKERYKELPLLMENLYSITCQVLLNEVDIQNFSFYSRIYIDTLGAYFLPNKITYKVGEPATVEMIKIRSQGESQIN